MIIAVTIMIPLLITIGRPNMMFKYLTPQKKELLVRVAFPTKEVISRHSGSRTKDLIGSLYKCLDPKRSPLSPAKNKMVNDFVVS